MIFVLTRQLTCLRMSQAAFARIFGFVFLTMLFFSPSVNAQQSLIIAATVNDEMISLLDVESRLALSIHLSDLPNTPETRSRLTRQILRSIIDEKLKLQEAQQFQITVSRSELARAQRDFERRADMKKGGLRQTIKSLGLDMSGILERLEAEIAWSKLISRRYLPTIDVSDQEVDDYLADIERNKGKPEYLVSEIFLPKDGKQNPSQIRALADRLIQQVNSGANFSAIARNFSQSASAATGGNLGWHTTGQLSREIDTAIQTMSKGQISQPIETLDGFHIVRLQAKRTVQPFREEAPKPASVTLHQAHLALPENAAPSLISETIARAQKITQPAKSCEDFDTLAKQTNSPLSGRLGTFTVTQLSKQLQDLVKTLPIGTPSAPVKSGDGIIVIMVCERKQPTVKKVTPEQRRERIRDQLIDERINLAAEQYLRNLRRTAIVDIRL